MRDSRRLLLAGLLLALLSLGLPWGAYAGTPGYLTVGSYVPGYCDAYYCYDGYYQPGVLIPGSSGGTIPGTDSAARFFVVATLALALVGFRLMSRRLLRATAMVAAAGIALHLSAGLTGGSAALALAAGCFWVLGRDLAPGPAEPGVPAGG